MKLSELKIGDLVEIHSEERGVTVIGTVTDLAGTSRGGVIIGQHPIPFIGDDWSAHLLVAPPEDRVAAAKRRATAYAKNVHSNIADRVIISRAIEVFTDALLVEMERVSGYTLTRRPQPRPKKKFWSKKS